MLRKWITNGSFVRGGTCSPDEQEIANPTLLNDVHVSGVLKQGPTNLVSRGIQMTAPSQPNLSKSLLRHLGVCRGLLLATRRPTNNPAMVQHFSNH